MILPTQFYLKWVNRYAFDLIVEGAVVVRKGKEGEKLTYLMAMKSH